MTSTHPFASAANLDKKAQDHCHDQVFGFVRQSVVFHSISLPFVLDDLEEEEEEEDDVGASLAHAFHLRIIQRLFKEFEEFGESLASPKAATPFES